MLRVNSASGTAARRGAAARSRTTRREGSFLCIPAVSILRSSECSVAQSLLLSVLSLNHCHPMAASSPTDIEHGVIEVLKNVSRRPIDPTRESDLAADLGFDSLQILEVVAELEDRFDISIPLNDVPAARTVGQVVAQVTALVNGTAPA